MTACLLVWHTVSGSTLWEEDCLNKEHYFSKIDNLSGRSMMSAKYIAKAGGCQETLNELGEPGHQYSVKWGYNPFNLNFKNDLWFLSGLNPLGILLEPSRERFGRSYCLRVKFSRPLVLFWKKY
ncbi:MAG: hypothetical protein FP816_02815 [Desulfobacteraceae bacterium]|nr:hypothetical protein [Desulfobacteraceae bacterium]MBU4055110.1 hypothetical protein [Pseudomonadota bacterium]